VTVLAHNLAVITHVLTVIVVAIPAIVVGIALAVFAKWITRFAWPRGGRPVESGKAAMKAWRRHIRRSMRRGVFIRRT